MAALMIEKSPPAAALLQVKGRLLDLSAPKVMGIINVTPDSFYAASKYKEEKAVLDAVGQMLTDGAAIIDIGGMSSRPGAALIDEEEELRRCIPAIRAIVREYPEAVISIDTVRARVAREAVENGAALINDISAGLLDPAMYRTVAGLRVPYILMHMKGRPENMQKDPEYEDVVREVLDFFIARTGPLIALGVHDIILDPGFGFGKSVDHNYQLLNHLGVFRKVMHLPLLAGVSRKSMINRVLGTRPEQALNGSTALHMAALLNGASLLRVHDVKEAVETVKLYLKMKENAEK